MFILKTVPLGVSSKKLIYSQNWKYKTEASRITSGKKLNAKDQNKRETLYYNIEVYVRDCNVCIVSKAAKYKP